jgi:thiol reductant ABC exporter CydC subunit
VISTLRRLVALTDAPRVQLGLVIVLGAATILFGVGLMATAGYLISRAGEHPPILSLTVAIVAVRFFGLGRPIVRYLERLRAHDLAFRVLGRVRVSIYERIEPLAPAQLAGYRDGDLLSRMVADVDALQNLHLRSLNPPLIAILAGAVSVAATAFVLPAAAVVLAAGLLVAGVAGPAVAAVLARRTGRREAVARGELTAELIELMGGAAELVTYGREDERLLRLAAGDRELDRLARRAALSDGLGDALRLLVTGATTAGVLAVAVAAHAHGRLDGVLIAMLTLLALASFECVQPLAQAARELPETIAAGSRVFELTDRKAAVVDPDRPAPFPETPFIVALKDVHARYSPDDPPVLNGVTLRLEPGRRVALVGPSGAGKTTVANMLLRFLDPDSGAVTIAGRDIRDYRQDDVRHAIAVAGQDSHLFSTSIIENVRFARPEATEHEIEAALRQAGIWEWTDALPDGWDTHVGERGRELSGGQRQRISLARALLADAPVLVLDEPTAHLDQPTAQTLMDDVLAAAGRRAVLLITHRPEGLEHMDEIAVLENGVVCTQ